MIQSLQFTEKVFFCVQDDVPAPSYGIGYYKSEPCKPTESEKRIFTSYKDHMMYPKTVRDMIQRLQQAEGQPIGKVQNKEFITHVHVLLILPKKLQK